MKEDGAGLLAVVKLVIAVILASRSQDNTLQAVGQNGPIGDEIEEVLKVPLRDDLAIALARRLPINDVASVRRGRLPVFPSCSAIDDLGRCSAVQ
jgi:hypothetical protein